jgi:FKBP-type peptidyl-prolyl cis-trans isomerase SlyD
MKISPGHLVELNYVLSVDGGEVVESSADEGPLQYLHGNGEIPERLEMALEGLEVGSKLELTLSPQEAFGDYDLDALTTIPRSEFPEDAELEPDQWIEVEVELEDDDEEGELELEMRVVEVSEEAVVLDANHPLAGKTITYSVEVREFHEATAEEREGRHVHGEHCDH